MTLDDVPNAGRRLMALRAALALHGFADHQVFIGIGANIAPLPTPPGCVQLVLTIGVRGDPLEIDLFCPCGPIECAWWTAHGIDALAQIWDALDQDARLSEMRRWFTPTDDLRLASELTRRKLIIAPGDPGIN
jgi:hypothetical protein